MQSDQVKKPREMPKGGKKGGAKFPRYPLSEAVKWAKKLVSKTHSSPQPTDVIFSGVVGSKHGRGNVKISALKQYGLMDGSSTGYFATELAKRINLASNEEIVSFLTSSALTPSIFKNIFTTFQGDEVSRARLRQRAADLNVHPDEADTCIEIYLATMVSANLVSVEGDKATHVLLSKAEDATEQTESGSTPANGALDSEENEFSDADEDESLRDEPEDDVEKDKHQGGSGNNPKPPRAVFNINITLDSSLDTEKLSRQLEILRKFRAI